MRVFLDTNVLVSAFATRGLCADVLRHVLVEHTLVTGDVVLAELRRVLRVKLKLPAGTIESVEAFLREYEVIPKPERPSKVEIKDFADRWVLATAVEGRSDLLVTGDRELVTAENAGGVRIVDPRGFWKLARGDRPAD